MDEDVYRTPGSDLSTLDERKGSAVKAILIATLVDMVSTVFIGVIITIIYGVMLAANGDTEEIIASKLSSLNLTSSVSLIILASGFLMTVFAGYLCAKLVKHSEYKTVTVFAAVLVVLGLSMGLTYYSIAENIMLGIVTLCCAYFGAWLYLYRKKRIR